MQLGKEFGLEGEKLLEFVREQQKLEEEKEEKQRREEEERAEKQRREEEERAEKQRREEEERAERQRREEEEREERRRRQDEEREARRQEREIRKLQHEADLMRQKEAAEAAKREHELELARLAATNGDGRTAERDDRMVKMIWTHICTGSRDLQIQPSGIELDWHQSSVLCCLEEHSKCTHAYLKKQLEITVKSRLR